MSATIPETGFVRLPQILQVIPVGKTTWWVGVKSGRFPKPVKLTERCRAWKAEDIHALIKNLPEEQSPASESQTSREADLRLPEQRP